MNIYVLDKQLNIVDVIDSYNSIIWTNRYYECGDFELYLSATPSLVYTLREDYYLIREGHEENAMIIETIQITTNEEDGNYLTVSGRCLKSIFYRRIIWSQTQVNGLIENCISTLINQNVISPSDVNRRISNVSLGYLVPTNTIMTAQYTGDNLGETITSICQSYGLGWGVSLDLENKSFIFSLYSGVDHSYNQDKTPWVIFSNEYDNLLSTEYGFSKTDYANVAKVAGEGEGLARKNITVGEAQGMERYESFVDARDVSSNEGEISDDEYYLQLAEKGNEKLAETVKTESFSGEVIEYQYAYGQDYSLGDIVEVVNEYGMMAVSRITEVIESEDESGIYTIPTFSTWEGFVIVEPEEVRKSMLFVPQPTVLDEPEPDPTTIEVTFTGKEFNAAIKTVANNTTKSYTDFDSTIQNVVFSDVSPNNYESDEIYSEVTLEETTLGYQFIVFALVSEPNTVRMFCDADTIILPLDMSYMFYNCSKLTEIDMSKFDTSIVSDMSYMFYNCFSSIEFALSEFDTSNVVNMSYMFYNSNATSLDLESFDTSKVTNMSYMFGGCDVLTEIELSNFDTSSVTNMSSMFFNCKALTSLSLSFDTSNVVTMNSMFYNCTALTSLSVSFDTSSVRDMTQMFASCGKLTSLPLLFDTSNVTSMRSMFANCMKLTSLDLTSFNTSNVTDMYCMFSSCMKLGEILVSSGKWVMNGNTTYMFLSCKVSSVTYV